MISTANQHHRGPVKKKAPSVPFKGRRTPLSKTAGRETSSFQKKVLSTSLGQKDIIVLFTLREDAVVSSYLVIMPTLVTPVNVFLM
jgi:hypothetical protein